LVAVASRKISDIQDIVDSYPNSAFAVQLDVSNADEIKAARAKVVLLNKDFDEWESTTMNVNF